MEDIVLDYLYRYKRLDQLCRDMFSSKEGVSEYIRQMESYSYGKIYQKEWKDFYYRLKHQRWLRNHIVHSLEYVECTSEDIAEVEFFFQQILQREDPIGQLSKKQFIEKQVMAEQKKKIALSSQQNPSQYLPKFNKVNQRASNKHSFTMVSWVFVTVLVIISILFIWDYIFH